MTKKKTDQKDVTLDKESKDSSSITFEKVKSSFTNTIKSADDLVHPKAGKITYLVFKIMTILTFTVGIPLFVLFYQFTIIDDAYTFENTPVVYDDGTVQRSLVSTKQFTYESIDQSIAEIEALENNNDTFDSLSDTNVFKTSYYVKDGEIVFADENTSGETTYAYFYSIFADTTSLPLDQWATNADTATVFSSFTKEMFNTFLIENSSYETITSSSDAKAAFRTTYPPQKYIDNQNDDIFKNGAIAGFVLVGFGIIFGLLWFWFSKFANVPLKSTKEEIKEQE